MGKVSRRITARGAILLLLSAGQFLLAVHFSNNLIFLSSFLATALVIAGVVTTWGKLAGVSIHAIPPEPVAVGQKGYLRFTVKHAADAQYLRVAGPGFEAVSSGPGLLEAPLDTSVRGVRHFAKLRLLARDPFGLAEARRWLSPEELPRPVEAVIYPRPDWSNPARPSPRPNPGGTGRSRDEVAGLRPYRPGDARGDISWRASARHRKLVVKEYDSAASEEARIFSLADAASAQSLEPALSQISAAVLQAGRDGVAAGIELPGFSRGAGRSSRHYTELLSALAAYRGEAG